MKQLPLRPNVCMIVYNSEHKLFLGQRHNEPEVWQFPQGGVESSSSLEETVLKELHEELGAPTELFCIAHRCVAAHEYEFSPIPERYAGRWRGQSQSFWLVKYLGTDNEIDLGKYDREFDAWKWCTVEEVQQLADGKRLAGYQAPLIEYERFIATADRRKKQSL